MGTDGVEVKAPEDRRSESVVAWSEGQVARSTGAGGRAINEVVRRVAVKRRASRARTTEQEDSSSSLFNTSACPTLKRARHQAQINIKT